MRRGALVARDGSAERHVELEGLLLGSGRATLARALRAGDLGGTHVELAVRILRPVLARTVSNSGLGADNAMLRPPAPPPTAREEARGTLAHMLMWGAYLRGHVCDDKPPTPHLDQRRDRRSGHHIIEDAGEHLRARQLLLILLLAQKKLKK